MPKHSSFQWTKEDIKALIHLWDDNTKKEIADKLGCNASQVGSMVFRVRKAGYSLPRKTVKGIMEGLIKEAISELKRRK